MPQFEAIVSRSGNSKVVTIPHPVRDDFEVGDRVIVTIETAKKRIKSFENAT